MQSWLTFSLLCLCVQYHVSPAHGWHPGWAGRGRCLSPRCQMPALTCRPWSAPRPTPSWPTSTIPAPARPPAAPMGTFQSEGSGSQTVHMHTHVAIANTCIYAHLQGYAHLSIHTSWDNICYHSLFVIQWMKKAQSARFDRFCNSSQAKVLVSITVFSWNHS